MLHQHFNAGARGTAQRQAKRETGNGKTGKRENGKRETGQAYQAVLFLVARMRAIAWPLDPWQVHRWNFQTDGPK